MSEYEKKYLATELKDLTVIVPHRVPKEIRLKANPDVTLRTILSRYEEDGDTILQNGVEKPLETIVEDDDILIIVRKREKDGS